MIVYLNITSEIWRQSFTQYVGAQSTKKYEENKQNQCTETRIIKMFARNPSYLTLQGRENYFNPLMPGGNKKVTHT